MKKLFRCRLSLAVATLLPAFVHAADAVSNATDDQRTTTTLGPVQVKASTPLLGSGLDANKVPNANYVLSRRDLSRTGETSVTGTLENWAGSVNLNSTIGNPNQPDLQFRGFTASPLQGLPQGLAVYQNGMRINESFGDTVNWDLIPMIALDMLNLTSSNPVFGFNALGGAVALEMKTGRTAEGTGAEFSTGSFGRRNVAVENGWRSDNWSSYIALSNMHDDGWRERQPSHGNQLYADLGYDDDINSLHLTINAGRNYLVGTGPTPEALLHLQPRSAPGLNYPAYNRNHMQMFGLQGSRVLSTQWQLQGNLHAREFRQKLLNGNVTDAAACSDAPEWFCSQGNDEQEYHLIDQHGAHVPVSAGGDHPASLDWADTRTRSRGAALMLTRNGPLFGRDNHLLLGASIDRGDTRFGSGAEIGYFDDARNTHGSGLQIDSLGAIRQVGLHTRNLYRSLYTSNTLDLAPTVSLTVGGRYNHADVRLRDQRGDALNGDHRFSRFNPGAGITWRFNPRTTAYLNYAETNRVPTAAELSCADPETPCTLASFFMADPPLEQVVSRTWEAGLRGDTGWAGGHLEWSGSVFRADNRNDILEIASGIPGRGYFQNAGDTRREGIELNSNYRNGRWQLFANYSLVDATYRGPLLLNSPFNPFADDEGQIQVASGDHIPGVPRQRLKLGADVALSQVWSAGISVQAISNQVMFQDQANQTARVPGYSVVGLHSHYRINPRLQLFASISNLFDRRYALYGTWTDASGVPFPQLPDGEIGATRAFGAAPPRTLLAGLKLKL